MRPAIRKITSEQTYPLRQKILRPHQTIEEVSFNHDPLEESFHLGAFNNSEIIGVASLFPESENGSLFQGDWRLRGMAIDSDFQGLGIGRLLLDEAILILKDQKAQLLWCNGRTQAMGFYLSYGFKQVGEEFQIKGIGPHLRAHFYTNAIK